MVQNRDNFQNFTKGFLGEGFGIIANEIENVSYFRGISETM